MSRKNSKKKEENKITLPSWFADDLIVPFRAGIFHAFLLHGDINGLVSNPDRADELDQPYIPLKKFLDKIFDERRMVIFYNIASGVRFPDLAMEREFRRIVGLDSEDSGSKDPIAAAKAGLAAKRNIPREPDACLALIEKVLKNSTDTAVVIQSAHFIAPATNGGVAFLPNERANIERLRNWAQDEELKGTNAIILLLTDQSAKVSSELRDSGNAVCTIFIPKPNKEERKAFIRSLVKKDKKTNLDLDALAHNTQGMNLRQILDVFLHSQKIGKPISLEYVKSKKREILNAEYGDLMEVVEPIKGLDDIGGLEYIKEFFKNVLTAIRSGEKQLVPMGISLYGPPGTGKTAIVEALAKEAGFNFVKMKNAFSMWVGESEARKEKQIYGLRALAPVVVMNDEADLTDAQRDAPKGDAGASERTMKMWMEFLSDPRIRGQVIVISCSNRPDKIDPALKRSGRSDERLLLPMPSLEERKAIFKVGFKYHDIKTTISGDFSAFAEATDGFSGADIVEKIIPTSYRFAVGSGKKAVEEDSLNAAIEDFIPSASQADIDRMTLLGLMECSSRKLLPPNIKEIVEKIKARNLVENLYSILEQIKARNIVDLDNDKKGGKTE